MRRLFVAAATAALFGLGIFPAHAGAGAGASQGYAADLPGETVRLAETVDLLTKPMVAWVDIPLEVTLPQPGSYALDANIHGRIWGKPPINTIILARLFNVTTNSPVPGSTRMIDHLADQNAAAAEIGRRATASISEDILVSAPTTIRVQVLWNNLEGSASIAQIVNDEGGTASLRYLRI
ncbi:hypothetical protein ABGB17_23725 [Sphaerisporangium sp. B11E5]|uniref:hypothetical protein n=1 Tax=Sphaerisporangium sp. B11E5 TaxID=3153563 RepID=UPI00325D685F